MRSMQQALRKTPAQALCRQALKKVQNLVLKSVPLAIPPVSCVRAHRSCSLDTQCKQVIERPTESNGLTDGIIQICSNRHSFLLAMQVAVECPGPQPNGKLRSHLSSLAHVPEDEICDVAHQLLREPGHHATATKTADLDEALAKAIDSQATSIAFKESESLVEVFDSAPNDGALNALEFEALLAEAKVQAKLGTPDMPQSRNALQIILPALQA